MKDTWNYFTSINLYIVKKGHFGDISRYLMLGWEGDMSPVYWDGEMNVMGEYLKKLSVLSFQPLEMTVKWLKMAKFVTFGNNWTFWYLKSQISDTKCPIFTKSWKNRKTSTFGRELVDNVTFLFVVAIAGFQTKQGFYYEEYWNNLRCIQTEMS